LALLFEQSRTQAARMVSPCGKVVKPGDAESFADRIEARAAGQGWPVCGFAQALLQLAHAPQERERLGVMARQAALQWEKEIVLDDFERELKLLGGG